MSDDYKFNTEYLVDIQTLLKQLGQLIEQAEWDGEPVDDLKSEYQHIYDYHVKTGSHFYPLF
jgi:hypothetical protein